MQRDHAPATAHQDLRISDLDDAKRRTEAGAWGARPGAASRLFRAPVRAARRRTASGVDPTPAGRDLPRVSSTPRSTRSPAWPTSGVGLVIVHCMATRMPRIYCAGGGAAHRREGRQRRVRGGADINALEAFHTDLHLLDAHQPRRYGGTGRRSTGSSWAGAARRPFIYSGGLNTDNVADAIAATQRRRHRQRHRGPARGQGPREAAGVRRRGTRDRAAVGEGA